MRGVMNISSIYDRAFDIINTRQFNNYNAPDELDQIDLDIPDGNTYILRILIRRPLEEFKIPDNLKWVQPLIEMSERNQKHLGVIHPFCYLTIRSTDYLSKTTDEWHVDGFSTRITHLPEQNYIYVDHSPTEFLLKKINIPRDFDPLKHNIHYLIQDSVNDSDVIHTINNKTLYCFDPYVIHRRPKNIIGRRTFIRISFTPIEINDVNNTENYMLKTYYDRDGIKDFRNKLERYPIK